MSVQGVLDNVAELSRTILHQAYFEE